MRRHRDFEMSCRRIGRCSRAGLVLAGSGVVLLCAGSVQAASIDNTATAQGVHDGQTVQSAPATESIEKAPRAPALELVAAAGTPNEGDGLDFTVTVRNTGNVALAGVSLEGTSLLAGGVEGAGAFGPADPQSATIAKGETQTFTVPYTLATVDIYRAAGKDGGIAATFAAKADDGQVTGQATASATIDAAPRLEIAKAGQLVKATGNTGQGAEAGDTITYTYTVSNTGNVPITGVTITDDHAGATLKSDAVASAADGPYDEALKTAGPLQVSADAGVDGSWDTLGPGGVVTFTFRHAVTQAEFEAQ